MEKYKRSQWHFSCTISEERNNHGVATEWELCAIHVALRKLHYLIYGGKITIRTDHKPLVDILSGTAKTENSATSEKLHRWMYDIIGLGPTIEYKKGSSNIIADSLSRLRTDAHYVYDKPLHNDKPIRLDDRLGDQGNQRCTDSRSDSRMRKQHTKTSGTPSMSMGHLQGVRQETAHQKCRWHPVKSLNPVKLWELQDNNLSITNLQRNRKTSIMADKNNVLRYVVDIKGETIQAILLHKALRPWIIASTHEFSGHQGDQRLYNKIRGTFFWNGMRNDICQAITNCRVCKMESPSLGKYMNLHLEIGTVHSCTS